MKSRTSEEQAAESRAIERSARAAVRAGEPKKPSRRELLKFIEQIQNTVGEAMVGFSDQNPNRAHDVEHALRKALDLCIVARSKDSP